MFCSKCGASVNEGQKFCMRCGAPVQQPKAPVQQRTQVQQPKAPAQQRQKMQQPKAPVQQSMPSAQPKTVGGSGVPEGSGKNGVALKIVLIVVAALLLLMILLLVGMLVFGGGSDGDSSWTKVFDENKKNTESSGTDKNSSEEDAMLRDKLDSIISEKGDIRGRQTDLRKDWEAEGFEGVTGAVIMDVSGDGINDLVVAYADKGNLYADVYTTEGDSTVCQGKHLVETPALGYGDGSDGIAGIYLKKTAGGWNLVGEIWNLAYMFSDGTYRDVKAVSCAGHTYTSVAGYSYSGSSPDESDYREGRKAAEAIGMSGITEPIDQTFFQSDTDIVMVCALHNEISYFGDTMQIDDGETYGTSFVDSVNGENNQPDNGAAAALVKKYQKYEKDEQRQQEEAYLDYEDYVLPQSAMRKLTAADMEDIKDDAWRLRLARNEIFARYGREFKDEDLRSYFNSKDWYEPVYDWEEFDELYNDNEIVSDVDRYNIDFIKKYEKKLENQ